MKRSDLADGDEVAVYVNTPIPADPYSTLHRHAVRKAVVAGLKAQQGLVVTYDFISFEHVESRQVITTWDEWERGCAERDAAAAGQQGRQASRLEIEASAFADARRRYPGAQLVDGWIRVRAEDWLT